MPELPTSQYTNPKDRTGSVKVPLDLLPPAALAHAAMAHRDGAIKYGPYNWRTTGVRASVYIAACMRHLQLWSSERQEVADDSKVHHLGHAIACLNIILDAQASGKLVDDRPDVDSGLEQLLDALFQGIKTGIYRAPESPIAAEPKTEKPIGPGLKEAFSLPFWHVEIEKILGSFPIGSHMPSSTLARAICQYSHVEGGVNTVEHWLETKAYHTPGDCAPWRWRLYHITNTQNDGLRWRGGKKLE
jgi:hypothetical protein